MTASGTFKDVKEKVFESLDFKTKDGKSFSVPFYQRKGLDYIKPSFHTNLRPPAERVEAASNVPAAIHPQHNKG
jgi:hypothetical protein